MNWIVVATCRRHPKYRGKNPPRTGCSNCWRIYRQMSSPLDLDSDDDE